jgi:hypothetical protein
MLEPSDLARYRRETRAMIDKAAADDLDSLAAVYSILADAQASFPWAVRKAMVDNGFSWRDIARAFAMPAGTVFRRFAIKQESLSAYRRLGGHIVSV